MITDLLQEYAKHSALNFGQVAHGLCHLLSHPDFDDVAPQGSLTHLRMSLLLRTKRIGNDLFFALIPPHWHHTQAELAQMRPVPLGKWFDYGYVQWRFDDTGQVRPASDGPLDTRWDSRCLRPMRAPVVP